MADLIQLAQMERRKHKRYYIAIPCWCEGNDITMFISISNISQGGFFLRTSNPLPIGKYALVSFKSEKEDEIVARVEVVWHSRGPVLESRPSISGMGTKLVDIVKGEDLFGSILRDRNLSGKL
jgi:hypothetical protein